MKFNRHSSLSQRPNAARGSAVLVVVILLGIMTLLVIANSRTLYYLHRDLKLIEQQQQRKFGNDATAQPASVTNQLQKLKSKG